MKNNKKTVHKTVRITEEQEEFLSLVASDKRVKNTNNALGLCIDVASKIKTTDLYETAKEIRILRSMAKLDKE